MQIQQNEQERAMEALRKEQEYKSRLQILQEKLTAVLMKKEEDEYRIDMLQASALQSNELLETMQSDLHRRERELAKVKGELLQCREDMATRAKEDETAIDHAQAQIAELKASLQESQEAAANAAVQVEQLAADKTEVENGKAQAVKELAETKKGKEAVEECLSAKETEAAALLEELGAAQQQVQTLHGALEQKEAATKESEARGADLKARLAESETGKARALGKIQELETLANSESRLFKEHQDIPSDELVREHSDKEAVNPKKSEEATTETQQGRFGATETDTVSVEALVVLEELAAAAEKSVAGATEQLRRRNAIVSQVKEKQTFVNNHAKLRYKIE